MIKLFFFFLAFSFAVIPSEINAQGRWLRYRKYLSISISNPILTIVSVGVLICAGLKIVLVSVDGLEYLSQYIASSYSSFPVKFPVYRLRLLNSCLFQYAYRGS